MENKVKIKRDIYEIDAANKSFGRVASQAAIILRGKHKPEFVPYLDQGDFVKIKNIEKIRITGRKLEQKIYYRHSGYLGNLKQETLTDLNKRKPGEFLRLAVYGMLPKNKLRDKMIKRLSIS